MPTVPIVRVPWNDQVHVKQALDVGADGVLAPMVRNVAEARALVAAAKYPPDGSRGFGPRRASDYGRNIDAYVAGANAATIVIPQIEHVETAAAIEEILDVPGVDALCIGPNDLSGSAGLLRQHDHPTVRKAIDQVLGAASARGVAVCTGITLPLERQQEWIARGARLTLLTSDVELLAGGAAAAVQAARAAFGR
jgi:2-keto-3-deoxy-L-rhamnonate aldolase RhmA